MSRGDTKGDTSARHRVGLSRSESGEVRSLLTDWEFVVRLAGIWRCDSRGRYTRRPPTQSIGRTLIFDAEPVNDDPEVLSIQCEVDAADLRWSGMVVDLDMRQAVQRLPLKLELG